MLNGGGAEICNSDQFHFAWFNASGDTSISARLVSVGNAPAGEAGLMLRNALSQGAIYAAVLASSNGAVRFQWRTANSTGCYYQILVGVQTVPPPIWLKLSRSGNNFSAYWSTNNTDWYQVGGTQTVAMNQTTLCGLVVSANDNTALAAATFSDLTTPEPIFGIYRELWTDLNATLGDTLAVLTNTTYNVNWPDNPNPDFTAVYYGFETETNTGLLNYGQRLRCFVVPPLTGAYRFWIASDNTSELYLSSDEDPLHKTPIASVSGFTASRQWTKEPNQQSGPLTLEGGHRYYLEAVMQQSTGPENLTVRWQLPDGRFEEPITGWTTAGTWLVPFRGMTTPPGIYLQPTNTIIGDGQSTTFVVLVTNQASVSYQWLQDGTNLTSTEAKSPAYPILKADPLVYDGRTFACVVSNSFGSITSAPALLNVIADLSPPRITTLQYVNETNLLVFFSEPVEAASATNTSNYSFTNGLGISQAVLAPENNAVTLTTSPLLYAATYALVINGIRDLASHPNTIATNTTIVFCASPYISAAVGMPLLPGTLTGTPDGFNLSGSGKDIGAANDQFQFAYTLLSGNFDYRVRVAALNLTDMLAKGGLMARENLASSSRYAAVFGSPTLFGAFFEARAGAGANATRSASLPVNYPDTWLRLQRTGNQFTGFGSYDGVLWQQLGTINLALTNTVCFGMAVCSRSLSQLAVAQFRELSTVTNAVVGNTTFPGEPPGPSTRRTGLAITEIMYHPAARTDLRRLEFIEIFNSQSFYEDISGYSITGDASFTFPAGTVLGAGAYLVIAKVPADVSAVYGITNVTGPYTNNLANNSGTVRLRNKLDAVLLEVKYDSVAPWPCSADGGGHSLVLANPSYGEGNPLAWKASDKKGGSPGRADGYGADPARGVVINEFLAHTDPPDIDTIELFNPGSRPVDLSGCFLSDDPDTNKFRIPDGTAVPARGFLAFNATQLGFNLDSGGETIYLVNAATTRVLDAVHFEGQANGVSMGRYPDGAPTFRALAFKTLGTNNSPGLSQPIVINEIMYDPISGLDDDQYVELYNRTTNRVDLSAWKFTAGVSYTFPSNTFINPGAYLVVARNFSRLLTNYPNLNSTNLVGNFSKSLSGKGERIALSMPDTVVGTNAHGAVVTNTIYILVNEVTYGTDGRWPHWANGGGSSLELIDPRADNSLAPNWADSDETAKAAWANVEYTGVLDLGSSTYGPDQLQLFLQGEGECLVDNVEVFRPGEANRITNPNFDSGTTGWYFQGTHRLSGLEASGGYGGGVCLHVRATGRGDTGANRIRTAIFPTTLASGNTATLRAKVRWLKGHPEILLRLHGNWLEAAGRMPVPLNLGTPGARNSRYLSNSGPAVLEVKHSPVLPSAGQPVVVTARVSDPDGLGPVVVVYRNDTTGAAPWTVNMTNVAGSAPAGTTSATYAGVIPGQTTGTLIAFYVQAADRAASAATNRFPNDAPTRECLVRFGETVVPGAFGNYRLWLTRANLNFWANREKLSSEPVDCTFVYGNSRAVYNMGALYSGSPFHTPGYNSPVGNACDYSLTFPADDPVLGAGDMLVLMTGNGGNDTTEQREQIAFWMLRELGAPSLHRRFVYMFVNGSNRGTILEDAQQPNADYISEYFPDDSKGQLHKIDDWFEFNDAASDVNNVDATLDNFTTTGGAKKTARYRWNWRPRAVKEFAHDFTNLFTLVDALHLTRPEPYTSDVLGLVEVDEWMRTFALERFTGNWDSFSYERGKNMYAYKPQRGPWNMIAFDIDFVFDLGGRASNDVLFDGQDASVNLMRSHPPFARACWRAFQDLIDGPALDTQVGLIADARYSGLLANGVAATAPTGMKSYIASRRAYVQSQLATVAATFNVSSVAVKNNVAQLTGTAPVKVKTILFNGREYAVTWTGVTTWTAAIPLSPGANPISVVGLDSYGQAIPTAIASTNATYTGALPSPAGQVLISEIMYKPSFPGAEYVELYNNSTNTTFDLSGWRFNGLSYSFPDGSVIGPTNYLVLSSDREAFVSAYGLRTPLFDMYAGKLQADGETLTLIQPGTNAASDLAVAKLRYDALAPWPVITNGSALQLLDSRQDNWRPGNWSVAPANSTAAPKWVYYSTNGTASSSVLYVYLQSAGDIYLDDLKLVAGTVPDVGPNLLSNGDFESAFPGPWTVSTNLAQSDVSSVTRHGGAYSLHLIASSGGSTKASSIWQNTTSSLTNGQPCTLSFWYLETTNGGPLVLRLSQSGIAAVVDPAPAVISLPLFTPGSSNSIAAALPAFPPLWINEILPENISGVTNSAGGHTPWIELYNPTTNSVPLRELYLSASFTNLLAWPFPAAASIGARQFKVIFADGLTNLSTLNELHTSFTLFPGAGKVALSRLYNGQPQVLDYLNYTNIEPNRAYGSWPDAQSFTREHFYYATPGASNNIASPVLTVVINEWMADNAGTLMDPADNNYEDWFELHNYGGSTVDLYDYYLTDNLTNRTQYHILDHHLIPPHGFLLVWADNETGQNSPGRPDLHVNFKLDKAGEAIGLFARDGAPVDYVTFGPQTADLSMGRYPDGASSISFLPSPTPRTNNVAPNNAPVLAPIADRVLVLGQTLTIFALANDPDPGQSLTYTLAPGAPPGAAIDPLTGLLTCTPSQAPSTNDLTVSVIDNGLPPLGATRTFTLTVLLPPQVRNIALEGSVLTFSFEGIRGLTYQLEYKENLNDPLWLPLGDQLTGADSLITAVQDVSASSARFFRVRLIQ